jgi:isopentenyl-diphosphate delta-isomerase
MTELTAPAAPSASGGIEQVVLCAEDGSAAGTAPKLSTHRHDTPLHLAFSCYLFDREGRVLVTRRAQDKLTFPGTRTNSCCGHPAPGEGMRAAVARRTAQELGVAAERIELILPTFRYTAVDASGIVENELCPVYRAQIDVAQLRPDPAEVASAWWVPWSDFAASAGEADRLSSWAADQVSQLSSLGPDPLQWPLGDESQLPPAARP